MAPTAAEPPPLALSITARQISDLDLSPLAPLRGAGVASLVAMAGQVELTLDWPRSDDDPRELSEVPEVRLWSLRADAQNPWLPLVLERSRGTLTRHVAMLLPHAFSRSEGIRFAPESLDLWITHRLFWLDGWSDTAAVPCRQSLGQMAAVLGFELDPQFWSYGSPPASP